MVSVQQDKQQVEGVIRQWQTAIAAIDMERVKALWDQSYPQLIFIAEENNEHLLDWASIAKYYDALPPVVEKVEWKLDNLKVDVIGDAAYAYYTFVIDVDVKGVDHTRTFDIRDTFILRRTGGQWKIIHFHESLSRDHSHETWGYRWK